MTLGDLLTIQRGRAMPMVWEHDIDICITPEKFPRFEKALASRVVHFEPKSIHYGKGHWYTTISIKVVHEQSGKVEYDRKRLLGTLNN
jgi:hypothetical protein